MEELAYRFRVFASFDLPDEPVVDDLWQTTRLKLVFGKGIYSFPNNDTGHYQQIGRVECWLDAPCPSCFQKYTALASPFCISVRTIRLLQLHLTLFLVFIRSLSEGRVVECRDS